MKVLITQSMLFPWIGMLSQLKLADVIVHYDDVQFSKGSFTNRIQIKTKSGMHWMTIPLSQFKLGMLIDQTHFKSKDAWKDKHMSLLDQSFRLSPFRNDVMSLVDQVYSENFSSIGSLSRRSMIVLADYFGLLNSKKLFDVRSLEVDGSGSSRVLDIVKRVGGSTYITGHGASKYLDHLAFQDAGIDVMYMNYKIESYPQQWGDFTPYVSGLDLVANMGTSGASLIETSTIPWQEFTAARC